MRIKPDLILVCHICRWRPPEKDQIAVVKKHFDEHHAGAKVHLDLSPICSCGGEMRNTYTTRESNRFRDHFKCDSCGNVGDVVRKAA